MNLQSSKPTAPTKATSVHQIIFVYQTTFVCPPETVMFANESMEFMKDATILLTPLTQFVT